MKTLHMVMTVWCIVCLVKTIVGNKVKEQSKCPIHFHRLLSFGRAHLEITTIGIRTRERRSARSRGSLGGAAAPPHLDDGTQLHPSVSAFASAFAFARETGQSDFS
jgi:hypothetical protein